jgi:hypothetical protein
VQPSQVLPHRSRQTISVWTSFCARGHGDLRLVCGCLAMETHFMKLPTNRSCADVASRGSLELGSECCNRGQNMLCATHFSTQRARSVSLCGLLLFG